MRLLRFFGIWAVLLVVAEGGPSQGAPSGVASEGGSARQPSSYRFRVEAPTVEAAGKPDGLAEITLQGFRAREQRPGAPELSYGTYRVAIPPGVEPLLTFRVGQEDTIRGVTPRPVKRAAFDVPSIDDDKTSREPRPRRDVVRHEKIEADPEIYDGRETWPRAVAWLGEVATFRDQRYVTVFVAPVRYDPASRGLRVARDIEVEVAFEGDDGRRTEPIQDARFEDVYRGMFVNYAEGTTYRLSALGASGEPAASAGDVGTSAGPRYKIKVRQNGPIRLDATRMSGTGFTTEALSTWKLSNRGVEVPLQVRDVNANDLLDAGDWVQFWGQALDDEPKTVLNTDIAGTDQDIFEARDFTDENVYFLTVETGSRSRMATRDQTPTNTRTPPSDFEATAHVETDDAFRPLGGNDPWYWSPTLVSNVGNQRTDDVPLPGLASTTAPLRVITVVRGSTESSTVYPDHHTGVTLLNASSQTLATNDDDGTFDGRTIYTHDFTWNGTGGTSSNPVKVRLELRPISAGNHQAILNWVEVKYRRTFQASGDILVFDWPDGDSEFLVSGLASSAPEVWELTGRVGATGVVAPLRSLNAAVTGAGPYTARFKMDNDGAIADGTSRRFAVFGSGAIATPANPDFVSDTVSDLRSTATQADLIVIAHPSVLGAASQATLNQLLSWRSANQGITSKTAWIEDIADEFNDGLPGPVGIKRFLQWVMSTAAGEGWAAPKPSYVLILGDGSFDYKAGTANGTYVPTQIMFKDDPAFGYYASDSILAAVVGSDPMPDLTVGRVPARSDAGCNTVLQKILNYQQAPPAGNWRRHALVVSDRGKNYNPNEAADFENTNDGALSWMKRPPHTSRHLKYWTEYCLGTSSGCTVAKTNQMRGDIKAALNGTDGVSDGAAIAQYIGHGNFDVWSDDAFLDNRSPVFDTDDLSNGGRLPVLFVHNCLSGGFMSSAARTLGKDIINKVGGGSVSLFAPSGLSNGYYGQPASEVLWSDFFGKRKERDLAVPVMDVYADLCGIGAYEPCQNYVLLGDPATRAIFPSVLPAGFLTATPGHTQVALSWTASGTSGARYDVYRAQDSPTSTYVRANGTPVTGTSFTDTGLTNAKTYFYYVVALDTDGFESRWSNFNSDCPVDGPDCVRATPLNPNPPATPTGLNVFDPETGGKLELTWNANTETDLKNYDVHWGTQSGVYTEHASAGKGTGMTLPGLVNGQTYYIAVTATNTSGLTSAPSTEKTGIPTYVRGLRSPQLIGTLTVSKSGSNAVLSWSAVTTDIYGKTETVAKYEVFRGTTATFVPGPANKLGETTGTSFTDTGAISFAAPNYHYLVRAVDAEGNVGGLGRQLPNGIDLLSATKSTGTPGNVVLSWPSVTTDFDGRPTTIDHYEIYARGTPFTRESIRDGAVSLLLSTASTSVDVPPPAVSQYYSVIVVDVKGNKSSF